MLVPSMFNPARYQPERKTLPSADELPGFFGHTPTFRTPSPVLALDVFSEEKMLMEIRRLTVHSYSYNGITYDILSKVHLGAGKVFDGMTDFMHQIHTVATESDGTAYEEKMPSDDYTSMCIRDQSISRTP